MSKLIDCVVMILFLIIVIPVFYDSCHPSHNYKASSEISTQNRTSSSAKSIHTSRPSSNTNSRSYRWIYDADTGIGYHSGESQCSVLSLKQHAMGSSNPHWVTFMITKYTSGTVRLIVSDGIYDHIVGNQSVWIEFDHASPLSLTSSKDGVKLVMYTDGTMLTRMKASTRMTINVKLDNQTTETLEFDLSNFKTQCPY